MISSNQMTPKRFNLLLGLLWLVHFEITSLLICLNVFQNFWLFLANLTIWLTAAFWSRIFVNRHFHANIDKPCDYANDLFLFKISLLFNICLSLNHIMWSVFVIHIIYARFSKKNPIILLRTIMKVIFERFLVLSNLHITLNYLSFTFIYLHSFSIR